MNATLGEPLQVSFGQSLHELKVLVNQVKTTMTKRSRPAKKHPEAKAKAKPSFAANANATATVPISGAPSLSAVPDKKNEPGIRANMHDYLEGQIEVASNEVVRTESLFPPLPDSPANSSSSVSFAVSPVAKTARADGGTVSSDTMTALFAEFSALRQLLNSRADALECMINNNAITITQVKEESKENAIQINAIKITVDQLYAELVSLKDRVEKLEARPLTPNIVLEPLLNRITNLENYSRRWNLILHGVEEKDQQDVRREAIRILQAVLPEARDKILGAVDTVHRLGPRRPNNTRSRPIIIQFVYRYHKDAIWAAAREGNSFLQDNGLRLSLDLSPEVREKRRVLWPLVDKARKEHKRAYFVGGRAFVDGVEIFPSG